MKKLPKQLQFMRTSLLLSLTFLVLFTSCGQQHKDGSFSTHYTHQPLKEFQDTVTEIPTGTEINILAYSGGDVETKKDVLNYCQFIVINKTTEDTLRILAAVINVEDPGSEGKPALSPSTIYDFDKGIRDATFKIPTDDDKMIIKMMPGLQGAATDPKQLNSDLNSTAIKEFVMLPDGVPFFARHYKTVLGILSFKQQPW
jgi:hypothetical protein